MSWEWIHVRGRALWPAETVKLANDLLFDAQAEREASDAAYTDLWREVGRALYAYGMQRDLDLAMRRLGDVYRDGFTDHPLPTT